VSLLAIKGKNTSPLLPFCASSAVTPLFSSLKGKKTYFPRRNRICGACNMGNLAIFPIN
jgi:hypothetical protein